MEQQKKKKTQIHIKVNTRRKKDMKSKLIKIKQDNINLKKIISYYYIKKINKVGTDYG